MNSFITYFLSFYGKDGLYPIHGLTTEMIKDAICEVALSGHRFDFGGDSWDRESVRDHILGDKILRVTQ